MVGCTLAQLICISTYCVPGAEPMFSGGRRGNGILQHTPVLREEMEAQNVSVICLLRCYREAVWMENPVFQPHTRDIFTTQLFLSQGMDVRFT